MTRGAVSPITGVSQASEPKEQTMKTTNAISNDGTKGAAEHPFFATAYQIIKSDRGTQVTGGGPDGRCTGTCDRCGTAILNIYVFSDKTRTSFMHVGIDCARKMGVPVEALKSATGFWRERAREADRAVRAASRAEKAEAEALARTARLNEHAALVGELEALKADPRATDWECTQLGGMIAVVGNFGADWTEEANDDNSHHWEADKFRRDTLACIRTRLALCDTSTVQCEAVTGKGKPAGFRRTLRAYRKCVVLNGQYGTTYVSFLTDDQGNAFVHKGSNAFGFGESVEATWTIDGSDTRDGLTATVLKRPRKIIKTAKTEATALEYADASDEGRVLIQRGIVAECAGVSVDDVTPDPAHTPSPWESVYVTAGARYMLRGDTRSMEAEGWFIAAHGGYARRVGFAVWCRTL